MKRRCPGWWGVGVEAEGGAISLPHLLRAPWVWLNTVNLLLSLKVREFLGRQQKGSFSWNLASHSCFFLDGFRLRVVLPSSGVVFVLCYDNSDTELSSFLWVTHTCTHARTHINTHRITWTRHAGGLQTECVWENGAEIDFAEAQHLILYIWLY